MPELPEVETYVRQLRPQLVARSFTRVDIHWPRTIAWPRGDDLTGRLIGQTITKGDRRGKYLRFWLTSGDQLLIHLKMSGRLRVESSAIPGQPHDRVLFGLDNGQDLRFNDTRKFGRVYLIPAGNAEVSPLGRLGPEPLDDDFTASELVARVRQHCGMIKPLLLNQNFVAGLGNIYADEALFRARIHPTRAANTLQEEEIIALHESIQGVLRQSIECLGTSFDLVYTGGLRETSATYQCYLQVYQRTGEPCPRCGHPLERHVVGGRGTHLCPRCQTRHI